MMREVVTAGTATASPRARRPGVLQDRHRRVRQQPGPHPRLDHRLAGRRRVRGVRGEGRLQARALHVRCRRALPVRGCLSRALGGRPRRVVGWGGAFDPDLVIAVDRATVTRGGANLLHEVSWQVELDERWVVLGPNGAGKTTLLNLAAARLHPTSGTVHVLGERLGRVDVAELRTRIGLSTAALHDRIPPDERVARRRGHRVLGRGRPVPGALRRPTDTARATALLRQLGVAAPGRPARTGRCPRASANGSRSPGP